MSREIVHRKSILSILVDFSNFSSSIYIMVQNTVSSRPEAELGQLEDIAIARNAEKTAQEAYWKGFFRPARHLMQSILVAGAMLAAPSGTGLPMQQAYAEQKEEEKFYRIDITWVNAYTFDWNYNGKTYRCELIRTDSGVKKEERKAGKTQLLVTFTTEGRSITHVHATFPESGTKSFKVQPK